MCGLAGFLVSALSQYHHPPMGLAFLCLPEILSLLLHVGFPEISGAWGPAMGLQRWRQG